MKNKIKLIYDIEIIGNSYKNNQTGIFRVAYELFIRFYKEKSIELFVANHNYTSHKETQIKAHKFISENNFSTPFSNWTKRIKFIPFRKEKPFRYLYKKLGISDYKTTYDIEATNKADIYHSLYFPVDDTLSKFPQLKKVITVHDLIPILFPEYNFDIKILKEAIESIIRNNCYVICVSENTKKDLLKYAPEIDENKVFVSLLAASKETFYICNDEGKFRKIKQKYLLPDKYFLSLSTLEPRKNIDHVIRCFIKTVTENKIEDLSLVLVGQKGWLFDKIFEEYENAEHLKDRIIITGFVPDEDLSTIYSHAHSFYYLSLYEGFGLPPLEAMQCGVATVVSDVSSLPEVVGTAGIVLNPKNEDALCRTMLELYNDLQKTKDLSKKGLERATHFSWEKCVAEHIEIYNKILSRTD